MQSVNWLLMYQSDFIISKENRQNKNTNSHIVNMIFLEIFGKSNIARNILTVKHIDC